LVLSRDKGKKRENVEKGKTSISAGGEEYFRRTGIESFTHCKQRRSAKAFVRSSAAEDWRGGSENKKKSAEGKETYTGTARKIPSSNAGAEEEGGDSC